MTDSRKLRMRIIESGYKAVEQLIKVAEEDIIKKYMSNTDDDDVDMSLAADKLKNAAAAKKLAVFDALEILSRVDSEKESLESGDSVNIKDEIKEGFAERRSK